MAENFIVRDALVADAAGIARVHVETWQAAYAGIVPDAVLAGLSIEQRTQRWQENISRQPPDHYCFVAAAGDGQVVGFASGGPELREDPYYKGELYALYVLPQYQGRGMGRALLQAGAAWLRQRGFSNMLIWVLKDNQAGRAFYAALGGRPVREMPIAIGGTLLQEVGYGYELGKE